MNQVQQWISNAATWVGNNSTDVVYVGLALAALLLLNQGNGRR